MIQLKYSKNNDLWTYIGGSVGYTMKMNTQRLSFMRQRFIACSQPSTYPPSVLDVSVTP